MNTVPHTKNKRLSLLANFARAGHFVGQLLLEPARCLLCAEALKHSQPRNFCPLCEDFLSDLTPIKTTLLGDDPALPVLTCFSGGFYEGPLQEAIYQIKYLKRPELALAMGAALTPPAVSLLRHLHSRAGMDQDNASDNCRPLLILPVPLHATKKRERGFNQAELLAAVAAKILDCRQDGKSLRRIRATSPQFGLNRSERRQNLDGAFAGPHRTALLQGIGLCLAAPQQRKRLEGQNVIIVDDVVTSGATIYECARAAASCGARVVGALTLARARWQNNSFAKRGNEDDIEDKDKNETETETRIPELIRPNRLFQSCDP